MASEPNSTYKYNYKEEVGGFKFGLSHMYMILLIPLMCIITQHT